MLTLTSPLPIGRGRKFGDFANGSLGTAEDLIIGLGHRTRKNKCPSRDESPRRGGRFLLGAVRAPAFLQMDTVSSPEPKGSLPKKECSDTCHSSAHFTGQEAGDSRRMDLCKATQ